MPGSDFNSAMTNRSLRTIRNELEFLADSGAISHAQLSSIMEQLPQQDGQRATNGTSNHAPVEQISRLSVASPPPRNTSPADGYQSYNEKQQQQYNPSPVPSPQPPPSYPGTASPPAGPPPLCYATALYAYTATDAGDLALAPNDRIAVTEYMNAEWWKGRSEKSGEEGIFPRAYVRTDEKIPTASKSDANPASYGNVPLQVSQGGSSNGQAQNGQPSKGQEMGKKFGKKLGNAAIFGAGATIGSNIVNGIL